MACKDYNGNVIPCPEGMKKGTVLEEVEKKVKGKKVASKGMLEKKTEDTPIVKAEKTFTDSPDLAYKAEALASLSKQQAKLGTASLTTAGLATEMFTELKNLPVQHQTNPNAGISSTTAKAFKLPKSISEKKGL